MTSKNLRIAGDWMKNGYLDGRDSLSIIVGKGGFVIMDQYADEYLYFRKYGSDCPIITNGVWTFAPDASENERLAAVGVFPRQMITETNEAPT